MSTTTILIIVGVYMLAGGLSLLLRPASALAILDELRASPALTYIFGAIGFIAGAALLSFYHDFSTLQRGIITVLAGALTLECLLALTWPPALYGFADKFVGGHAMVRGFAIVALVTGAGLLYLAHT